MCFFGVFGGVSEINPNLWMDWLGGLDEGFLIKRGLENGLGVIDFYGG
jgi:hypothetical protein